MIIHRTYRVKIRLTGEQESKMLILRDGQRHAYNWAVRHLKSGWDCSQEYAMHRELTVQRGMTEWMRKIPVAIQRAGIRDAFTAARAAKKRGRGIQDGLRFRSKKRPGSMVFKCGQAPVVSADARTIRLPCFDTIECRGPIPDELLKCEPRSYEFVDASARKDGRGAQYILYVSCMMEAPDPRSGPVADADHTDVSTYPRHIVKGIDRGTVEPTVVVTLNGQTGAIMDKTSYDTTISFKSDNTRHRAYQQKISKMGKRSRRRWRLKMEERKRRARVANRRRHAECVAAKHICADYNPRVIVLERLALEAMTRSGRRKNRLNFGMRFARHFMIAKRISDRAEKMGIVVAYIDPRYTSQTCYLCGHVDAESRATRDIFKCTKCHNIQHADVNAASVIGGRGLQSIPEAHMQEAGPPEVSTPFVRRELDARLGIFTEGAARRRDNQASVRHHAQGGAEKERRRSTLSAECRHGGWPVTDKKYRAKVPIRHKVDENSARASYKNGMLEVTFSRLEEKPQGRTVEVG